MKRQYLCEDCGSNFNNHCEIHNINNLQEVKSCEYKQEKIIHEVLKCKESVYENNPNKKILIFRKNKLYFIYNTSYTYIGNKTYFLLEQENGYREYYDSKYLNKYFEIK